MVKSTGLTGTAIAAPVDVVRSILMPFGAVGLHGHGMNALNDAIYSICSRRIPTQVVEPIVGGVGVGIMTSFVSLWRWANKGHKYQSMNTMSSSGFARKHDRKPSVLQDNGFQYAAMNGSLSTVTSDNYAAQRTHSSKAGNFISSFVPGNGQPNFFHVSHSSQKDAL